MIIDDKLIKRVLRESIEQLVEDANPAYSRGKGNAANIKEIWAAIDRKQKELYDYVFGDLSDQLYDITAEKARVMRQSFGKDYDFVQIPNTICSAGNEKLPSNVLIINMSSSLMCPSYYLGTCTIKNCACYAQRAENQYSGIDQESVLTNRWKTDIMHTQMLQQYEHGNKVPMKKFFSLVETYIQLGNAYSKNILKDAIAKLEKKLRRPLTKSELDLLRAEHDAYRITDVRLNETGDFHCQLAVQLWDKFAQKIKKKYGIRTHAYTARHLDFSNVAKNIAINASNKGVQLGDEVKSRHFFAVAKDVYDQIPDIELTEDSQPILNKKYKNKWYYKCPCGQGEVKCDLCGVCFNPNLTGKEYTIFVEYHGLKNARGFKHLFTNSEVEGVMERLRQNGWITDEEYAHYKSPGQQQKLDTTSQTIMKQRTADTKKKKKKTSK
jgi:hypothetical protein